jgi:hypothetical protein
MLKHWGKFIFDFCRGIEDILEEAPETELGFATKKPLHRKWHYRQKMPLTNRLVPKATKLTKTQELPFHLITFCQLYVVERRIGKRL